MKVAITFIGTNKYLDFLPQYYENIEKYFLPNTEKVILAFTDGEPVSYTHLTLPTTPYV